MTNKGSISFHGELFEGDRVTPAIKKALEEARLYGSLAIRSRTPVRTGNLKSKWQSKEEGNGIRWSNDAPYAIYVEMGTSKMAARRMLADSIPEIQDTFNKALAREVGKALAARITVSAPEPTYEALTSSTFKKPLSSAPDGALNRIVNKFKGGLR